MHVLGVLDQRRAAVDSQGGTAVDRARADAYRAIVTVPADLHEPVEQFLDRAGPPFHPGHVTLGTEVLRGLHDAQRRLSVEVREHLGGQVRARGEVGVQDQDEFAGRAGEPEPQVTGFLHPAPVRAHQVGEPEVGGHGPQVSIGAVVEHVGGRCPRVGPDELEDVHPGVVQHGQRLAADRKEDIQGWVLTWPPRSGLPVVGGQIEGRCSHVDAQRDDVVGDGEGEKRQERPGDDRAEEHEPALADQQRAETGQRRGDDEGQVPVGVARLLPVRRRGWQHHPVPAVPAGAPARQRALSGGHSGPRAGQVPRRPRSCRSGTRNGPRPRCGIRRPAAGRR